MDKSEKIKLEIDVWFTPDQAQELVAQLADQGYVATTTTPTVRQACNILWYAVRAHMKLGKEI